MNTQNNDISMVFEPLDKIFSTQRCIEDKTKYFEVRNSIIEQIYQLFNIIEDNYDNHLAAQRRVNESFLTIGSLKESYFKLSSIYLRKNINIGQWIVQRKQGADNLTDFYWLESPRKIRNIIAHNSNKPVVEIKEGGIFFNYFNLIDGQDSKIPLLHHNNNQKNLVNLKYYIEDMISYLSQIIYHLPSIMLDNKSELRENLNQQIDIKYTSDLSEIERQTRKFIGLFEYTKEKCSNLISAYERGEYNLVNKYYIAELYIYLGHIYAKNELFLEALELFEKSLALNHDISQVSNIIGACTLDISNREFVHSLIECNFELACNNQFIRFFGNAGFYLSELENNDITRKIFSAGFEFINENKESVDYLYNYAHFLKNNIHDYFGAINLCLKILEIDPIDKGAHKMLLLLYNLTGQHDKILKHIEQYSRHIKNDELKKFMHDCTSWVISTANPTC